MKARRQRRKFLTGLLISWFNLTANEQKAVLLVTALCLLGLIARFVITR